MTGYRHLFLMTPIYRASLTLQIDREDIKIVKIEEVTPVEGQSGSGQDYYQTQYELLKSRSLVSAGHQSVRSGRSHAANRTAFDLARVQALAV